LRSRIDRERYLNHIWSASAGKFWGKAGPVDGIAADPISIEGSLAPGRRKPLPVETTRHAFV
jgi:hypothetical protein